MGQSCFHHDNLTDIASAVSESNRRANTQESLTKKRTLRPHKTLFFSSRHRNSKVKEINSSTNDYTNKTLDDAPVESEYVHSAHRAFPLLIPNDGAPLSVVSCERVNNPSGIIIAYEKGIIKYVNYETGQLLKSWASAHLHDINVLTKPAEDGIFASGSRDKMIKVWNIDNEKCLCSLEGHKLNVSSVDIFRSSELIVSGSKDNTVRIWDVECGEEISCADIKLNLVHFVKYVDQIRCVAQGGEDLSLRLWDVRTAGTSTELSLLSCLQAMDYYPTCAEIKASEPHMLFTGHNGFNQSGSYIMQWDIRMAKCVSIHEGHSGTVRGIKSMKVTQDDRMHPPFLSCSDDGNVGLWRSEESSKGVCIPRWIHSVRDSSITSIELTEKKDLVIALRNGSLSVFRFCGRFEDTFPFLKYRYLGFTNCTSTLQDAPELDVMI